MGLVVSVGGIYEGIASCMFVQLEFVGCLVCGFVVPGYAKAFYVWVSACGE